MAERARGRPRDPKLDDAIAHAAREVMLARGYHAASYAEIARRAGVGTPAIYRRWPNKAAIAIDLIEREVEPTPIPDTGSISRDLGHFMQVRIRNYATPLFHHVLLPLAEEAFSDAEVAGRVRQRFFAYREPNLRGRIRKAIAAGQLRPDTDPDALIDVLEGALNMRALFSRAPLRPRDAPLLVDQVLTGFGRKRKRAG